jgi:hypothetical protein
MPHINDDETLIQEMAHELELFEGTLTIVLRPTSALYLAGLLQLALRHPGLKERQRQVAVIFVDHVRAYFQDAPAIMETLKRGDRPDDDR